MRALLTLVLLLGVVAAAQSADAVTGRIVKVLPFLVDHQGRIATSPSLFDRDAYQAYLRDHSTNVAAVRFDILWKANKAPDEKLKLAVEARGIGVNGKPGLTTLETNVAPGMFRQWTSIPMADENYKHFGKVIAWRVTLWNGDQKLDQQQSFLW